MGKRVLRREHVVAASLVGTVVVVVGYASGLGLRPVICTDAPTTDAEVAAPRSPATAEQPAPATTAPVQPAANPGARRVVRQGPAAVPPPLPAPPPTSDQPQPPHPHPPTPPGMSPPPTPPCAPGLVPDALDTLLQTLGRATDALGLLAAPAVAPLPVADGATPVPAPEGTPLDQLLRACPPTTPSTPATPTP